MQQNKAESKIHISEVFIYGPEGVSIKVQNMEDWSYYCCKFCDYTFWSSNFDNAFIANLAGFLPSRLRIKNVDF